MARPRKEGLDYFPHDVTLTVDKKVEALRILHGNDGYAFYCIMLENIYQEANFELNVSDAETIQILAKKVEVTQQKLEDMIKTSIKHGCFDREKYEKEGVLTSNGIKKRAAIVVKKRVDMRVSYDKRVSGLVSDAETMSDMPQSKVKESKEKNKTLYGDHVQMTKDQHQKLITDFGQEVTTDFIDKINYWFTQKPERLKNYKSHYLMVRKWKADDDKRKSALPSNREAETQKRLAEERKREEVHTFKPDPILGATGT